jgi:hypothetical protein
MDVIRILYGIRSHKSKLQFSDDGKENAHMENCHGPLAQGEDISSNFKHQTEEKLEKGDNYHLPTTL